MRDIKVTYNHIQNIHTRSQTILKDLEKRNVLTAEIAGDIQSAKSLDELDFLVSPTELHSIQWFVTHMLLFSVYAIQRRKQIHAFGAC